MYCSALLCLIRPAPSPRLRRARLYRAECVGVGATHKECRGSSRCKQGAVTRISPEACFHFESGGKCNGHKVIFFMHNARLESLMEVDCFIAPC